MTDGAHLESINHRAIELLATLVGFDSVSHLSNLPVLRFIERTLNDIQVPCTFLPSPDGTKGNLLARIGPEVEGGVILSGHTDVVPVEGQSWDSSPFTLTLREGKFYGRGTADMKSFIAVCLAMAPEFQKLKLAKPIYLAFSYDEEIGCLGAPHLLAHISKSIPKPSFAVIGEPTMMQVVTAHKGVLSFETTVTGLEWHSSQPHYGVNTVHYAAELVHFLNGLGQECAAQGKQDERFDPPYTTVHVGVIHGGTARNIIPKECKFSWEIRPLPEDDPDAIYSRFEARCNELIARMQHIYGKAGITTRANSRMMAVTLPNGAEKSAQIVMRAAKSNQELAVSFATEAGIFNEHGVPAIVCGPGNIEQAHKPNEFIDASQIKACVEFMMRLTEELSDVQ